MHAAPHVVSDVMTRDVAVVRRDTVFKDIVRTLHDRKVSAVPVVDGGRRVLGVVSEADLLPKEEFRDSDPDRYTDRHTDRDADHHPDRDADEQPHADADGHADAGQSPTRLHRWTELARAMAAESQVRPGLDRRRHRPRRRPRDDHDHQRDPGRALERPG